MDVSQYPIGSSQYPMGSSPDMRIWERRLLYCVPVSFLSLYYSIIIIIIIISNVFPTLNFLCSVFICVLISRLFKE